MKLTGQCKVDFETWLLVWIKKNIAWETETPDQHDIDHFYKFPLAMQFGVIQEFADSVGYVFEIQVHTEPTMQGGIFKAFKAVILHNGRFMNTLFKTAIRTRAMESAIEKFNQIYNKE